MSSSGRESEDGVSESYAADHKYLFLAADGSMMCEAHPGYEWGKCPGGAECVGPGMPWTIQGRTLIDEVITERTTRK